MVLDELEFRTKHWSLSVLWDFLSSPWSTLSWGSRTDILLHVECFAAQVWTAHPPLRVADFIQLTRSCLYDHIDGEPTALCSLVISRSEAIDALVGQRLSILTINSMNHTLVPALQEQAPRNQEWMHRERRDRWRSLQTLAHHFASSSSVAPNIGKTLPLDAPPFRLPPRPYLVPTFGRNRSACLRHSESKGLSHEPRHLWMSTWTSITNFSSVRTSTRNDVEHFKQCFCFLHSTQDNPLAWLERHRRAWAKIGSRTRSIRWGQNSGMFLRMMDMSHSSSSRSVCLICRSSSPSTMLAVTTLSSDFSGRCRANSWDNFSRLVL